MRHLRTLETQHAPHQPALFTVAGDYDSAGRASFQRCRQRVEPQPVLLNIRAVTLVTPLCEDGPDFAGEGGRRPVRCVQFDPVVDEFQFRPGKRWAPQWHLPAAETLV